jgi:hypothetical protein
MDPPVICSNCGHRLDPPPRDGDPGTTCPRCGAAAASETAVQAGAPNELPSLTCPHCGKSIPARCLFCPHCEQALEDFVHRLRANTSSPAGQDRSNTFEAVLAGFGVPFLLVGLLWSLLTLAAEKSFGWMLLAGYLSLLGLALVIAVVSHRVGNSGPVPWDRVFVRMMALLGVLVLVAMAGLILFFVVCTVAKGF